MGKKKIVFGAFIVCLIIVSILGFFIWKKQSEETYRKILNKTSEAIIYNTSTDANIYKQYADVLEMSLVLRKDYKKTYDDLTTSEKRNIQDLINKSKEKDEEINSLLKSINNPPSKYNDDYKTVQDMYELYLANHSGAINSDHSSFFINKYQKVASDFSTISTKGISLKKRIGD